MKVWNLNFQVEVEETDPEPNGTVEEVAVQIFNAIKARAANTFTVTNMTFNTEGRRVYTITAKGKETEAPDTW